MQSLYYLSKRSGILENKKNNSTLSSNAISVLMLCAVFFVSWWPTFHSTALQCAVLRLHTSCQHTHKSCGALSCCQAANPESRCVKALAVSGFDWQCVWGANVIVSVRVNTNTRMHYLRTHVLHLVEKSLGYSGMHWCSVGNIFFVSFASAWVRLLSRLLRANRAITIKVLFPRKGNMYIRLCTLCC